MFAKLKKKIQEESGDGDRNVSALGAVHGSPLGSGSSLASPVTKTNIVSSMRKTNSVSSVNSLEDGDNINNTHVSTSEATKVVIQKSQTAAKTTEDSNKQDSKEEVLSMLMKRTEQVKKLEGKISEYASNIKEKMKLIEQLESTIEKQTQVASTKIQEMNEQYQASRAKLSEGFTLALQKKEEDMEQHVNLVQQEKLALEKRLKLAEEYRDKYYRKEEETEEFEGFTAQESAKVKHLLLNKEEELTQCRNYLQEKMTLLEKTTLTNTELESRNKYLELQTQELTEYKNTTETKINEFEVKCEDLQKDKQQLLSRLSNTESSFAELQHEHQKLERSAELHKTKMSALADEKDCNITHLKDRVETLEQRLQDSQLSGDERTQALETERITIEQKLSEARQQLTEIKSSWSDKINHLEQQISHLNAKIVEDREELVTSEKAAEDMRVNFQKQIDLLQENCIDSKQQAKNFEEMLKQKEAELEKQTQILKLESITNTQQASDIETELRVEIVSLEKQIKQLEATCDLERSEAQEKNNKFDLLEAELLQKEIDHEQQLSKIESECNSKLTQSETECNTRVTKLEEKLSQLQHELAQKERDCSTTLKILDDNRQEVSQLRAKIGKFEESILSNKMKSSDSEKKFISLESEYQMCLEEKDRLLMRNAELSQQLERLKKTYNEQIEEKTSKIDNLNDEMCISKQALGDKTKEIEQMRLKLEASEQSICVKESAINSQELYKTQATELELQLAEKTKTIKMLQQRLSDLKKTLQRELKVQALPIDDQSDSGSETISRITIKTETVPKADSVAKLTINSFDSKDPQSHYSNMAAKNSATQHLNVHVGASEGHFVNSSDMRDVNFEYLKHVLLKFMLSRDSEAVHLIKAISMLLDFSPEEEKLIKETLEYKMSWFGRPPLTGKGQKTKGVPPTY